MLPCRGKDSEYDSVGEVSKSAPEATPSANMMFTELFHEMYSGVYYYVARAVGNTDADDLVADVFTTVWSRWRSIPWEPPAVRRAWVFGVARNKILAFVRHVERRRRLMAILYQRALPQESVDVGNLMASSERIKLILSVLPPSERDAIVLTVLSDLSTVEAAAVLRCSASSITTRVYRARRRLQEYLHVDETSSDAPDRLD